MIRRAAYLLVLLMVFPGCATLLKEEGDPLPGNDEPGVSSRSKETCFGCQNIPVHTEPAGAVCNSGDQSITTPGTFRMTRAESHTIVCRKPGYETFTVFVGSRQSAWLWGNLVSWNVIGFMVDFISRNAFVLMPKEIRIPLRKVG